MNTEMRVFDLSYWITERYAMKLRREAGEFPWSADPYMATVRYCNVHREDDAVTKWFREYWNRADDEAWKFTLGRLINLTSTLEHIRLPTATGDLEEVRQCLHDWKARGNKTFTSVYTISTCGERIDKIDYVIGLVGAMQNAGEPEYFTLSNTHAQLTCVPGLGDFLSGQIIADMKNTVGHPLCEAEDFYSWCAPGPGSINGLRCFFPGRRITKPHFHRAMAECRAAVDPLIPSYIPRISAQDFQNCLCEFSKYYRVKYERGHVRNKYDARNTS